MLNSFVGIDSMTFYHEGKTTFRAPLGVAIEVTNYDDFNEKYVTIIKELKDKFHLDTPKLCVKGHFITSKIGPEASRWFNNEFVGKIIPELKMIYVCHAVISPIKIPNIIFSNGTQVPAMKFVDILTSSFNHVIAWNLLNQFSQMNESHLYIDHFTAVRTNAWDDLEANKNIFILSSGEYCNSLISTSDLLCKFINDNLFLNNKKMGFDGISEVFSAQQINEIKPNMDSHEVSIIMEDNNITKLYQTGNSPFSMITPNSRRNIEVDSRLKHPVTFVLPSHKVEKEKKILENSPIFDLLVNDAFTNHGCVRSINLDDLPNDVRYMKAGDKVITIGDKALEDANYLVKGYGLPVEIITSDEILKNK